MRRSIFAVTLNFFAGSSVAFAATSQLTCPAFGEKSEPKTREVVAETAAVDARNFGDQIAQLIEKVAEDGRLVRFRLPGQEFDLIAVPADLWEALGGQLRPLAWIVMDAEKARLLPLSVLLNWTEEVNGRTHRIAFNVDGEPTVVVTAITETGQFENATLANAPESARTDPNGRDSGLATSAVTLRRFVAEALFSPDFGRRRVRQQNAPDLLAVPAAEVRAHSLAWLLDVYSQTAGHPLDGVKSVQIASFLDGSVSPEVLQMTNADFQRREGRLEFRAASIERKIILLTDRTESDRGRRGRTKDQWLFLPL